MEATVLQKALVNTKRIYLLLNEVWDISGQLADALDRQDQVTLQMLVSMRQGPIDQLAQTRSVLIEMKNTLPEQQAQRLGELLNGAEAREESEAELAKQVCANQRMLAQVIELDKRLNRKLTREKSIYQ